jgi:uncharacterized membrane protein
MSHQDLDPRADPERESLPFWRAGWLRWPGEGWTLAAIVAVAAGLRGFQLGRLSFWYDEVVTMRLARAGSPGALFETLSRIDATRAPLHPLLLQAWIAVCGQSEVSARGLSVLCGMATIVLIHQLGRAAFDSATGLWAAWLGSLSPLLIVYAREARMYAWLVMVTCLCWLALLRLRGSFTTARAAAYVGCLTALVYSHPLGLLMLGTLALAGWIGVRSCFGSLRRWLLVHLAVVVLAVPWMRNYFDHPPEFESGRLPLRFLLGTPIGVVGGNSTVLLGLVMVIALGVAGYGRARNGQADWRTARQGWLGPAWFLLWLILPPTALYLYSWVAHPVFGPARYTVFVAPAYLVLVALGLSRIPAVIRYPVAVGLTVVSALALGPMVYDPELKADWRGFGAWLAAAHPADRPGRPVLVIVASSDPARNVEVETARYYLPAGCAAIALGEATPERLERINAGAVYLAVGARRGVPMSPVPERIGPYRFGSAARFPGLMVWRAADRPPSTGGDGSAASPRSGPRNDPGGTRK